MGVVLDDDALTARLLGRIRDHAMRVKQEATPDELRGFCWKWQRPTPLAFARAALNALSCTPHSQSICRRTHSWKPFLQQLKALSSAEDFVLLGAV